jgi:hypothetical protein
LAAGDRILNIPLYTENTSFVYHTAIFDDAELVARISNSLVGPTVDTAYAYVDLRSYDIVNARLQLDKGPASYAFYITNLTNTHAELTANDTALTFNTPSLTRISTNQPLTIGFDLRYKF